MTDVRSTRDTHPLIIVAAIAVILTCLVGVAAMTGVIPVSKNTPDVATAPAPNSALSPSAKASVKSTAPRTAVGSTPGSGAVGSGNSAQTAAGPCTNCGTVIAVRANKQQGDASMIGPAAGALLGGVLGHQIGSGTGQTIATVVGAGAGAVAGTEVERRYKSTTTYVINVRMDDGSVRHFSSPTQPTVEAGAKVKVVDGKLMMG